MKMSRLNKLNANKSRNLGRVCNTRQSIYRFQASQIMYKKKRSSNLIRRQPFKIWTMLFLEDDWHWLWNCVFRYRVSTKTLKSSRSKTWSKSKAKVLLYYWHLDSIYCHHCHKSQYFWIMLFPIKYNKKNNLAIGNEKEKNPAPFTF